MRNSIIYIFLIFASCSTNIVYDINDIQYEKLDLKLSKQKLNPIYVEINDEEALLDNVIFKNCRNWVFDFSYINSNGKEMKFDIYSPAFLEEDSWSFIEEEDSSNYISSITISSLPKLVNNMNAININYINNVGDTIINSRTSIVENYRNLWMHFPRHGIFKQIFTAPWPYFEFPIIKGKSYSWNWNFNEIWGDSNYVQWKGVIGFDYDYHVVSDNEILELNFGSVKCYKINAMGSSRIGNNSVNFYFHPELGVLKAEYYLLNNNKLIMEAIEINSGCR